MSIVLLVACKRRAKSDAHSGREPRARSGSARSATSTRFRDGDLIFQESRSSQSEMVHALTGSRWTHMGVIFNEPQGAVVLEAVSPVKKTALQPWIARGRDKRYVVKRLRDADSKLSPDVIDKLRKLGDTWLGRPYDLRFRWDDQSLYCSELAYKLLDRAAGVRVGKLQRADEMNLADERVQRALRKRFANASFDPAETIVTPDSMFNDDQLLEVEP
ncbi:MAG TPA: YiiX/YebB-like N1pC/P60 family cysteine hydrolase [Polyangiaceae bacterium]|nr:YiiX/YebB-like N1pC/P60 family cysteine hydrolase [Polyangiaceae bacterium]